MERSQRALIDPALQVSLVGAPTPEPPLGGKTTAEFFPEMLLLRCSQCHWTIPEPVAQCPGCGRTFDWEKSADARSQWEQRQS